MGMTAAGVSYRRIRFQEVLRRRAYGVGAILLFAVTFFSTITDGYLYRHPYLLDTLLGAAMALGLTWAGRHCMHPEPRHPLIIRALSAKPLVWLGMFSYSLYLIHVPVWLAVEPLVHRTHLGFTGEAAARILLGIPLAIGCSYLFFLVIERPAMAMRPQSPRKAIENKSQLKRRPLNLFVHRASECLTDHFPNGDGLICYSILAELARRGHRVFAYTNRDEVKSRPANLEIRSRKHWVPANSLADHEHAFRAAYWLRELEQTHKIDLVWRMQPLGESCPTVPYTSGQPLVLGPLFYAWPKESVTPIAEGKPRFGFGIRSIISPITRRGWAKTLEAASLVMCTTDVLASQTRGKTLGNVSTVPVIVDAPSELTALPRTADSRLAEAVVRREFISQQKSDRFLPGHLPVARVGPERHR